MSKQLHTTTTIRLYKVNTKHLTQNKIKIKNTCVTRSNSKYNAYQLMTDGKTQKCDDL